MFWPSVTRTGGRSRGWSAAGGCWTLLEGGPPAIRPVPVTDSVETALDWVGALGGVEGVVMKPNRPYIAVTARGG